MLAALISPTPSASEPTCREHLANVPITLWETSKTYAFLRLLDAADCPKLIEADFEEFVRDLDVNFVSYALLEERLLAAGEFVASKLIDAHVEQYSEAGLPLDENAILPLIDIFFYNCDGEPTCIGRAISGAVGDLERSLLANCLYAAPGHCRRSDVPDGFVFLNDESLTDGSFDPSVASDRQTFICHRYGCPAEGPTAR